MNVFSEFWRLRASPLTHGFKGRSGVIALTKAPEIYVRLLDEAVDVFRPVRAESLSENRYRILDQPYDRGLEHWQFEPGDEVNCQRMTLDGESVIVAADLA